MAVNPVHVAVSGFSWTSALVGLLNLMVGGALVAWIKLRPKMREIDTSAEEKRQELSAQAEARLRDDLIARVEKLERKLDEERAQHEAVVSIMRHRLNNSDQCIEALLIVLDDEDLPPKVKRAVAAIKEMRARLREAEALEKATIHAAKITAAAGSSAAAPTI